MPKLPAQQRMEWKIISGIVIGVVALAVIIGLVVYFTRSKSKKTGKKETTETGKGTTTNKDSTRLETSKPQAPPGPEAPSKPQVPPKPQVQPLPQTPPVSRCVPYGPPPATPPPNTVDVLPGYVNEPYLDESAISLITNRINDLRDQHNACDLTYNDDMARGAQRWASTMATQDSLVHSNDPNYGENIYSGQLNEDPILIIKRAIDLWYCEELKYDYNNPPRSPMDPSFEEVGHFTNLVWASSQYYGIGIAKNTNSGNTYVVLRTYVPGNNFTQRFTNNVLPPQQADFPTKDMKCANKQLSNF